jgi:exodeoxyribonuclease VII small subunit
MTPDDAYLAAYKELKQIASDLEKKSFPVDEMASKIKRATELIVFCEANLPDKRMELHQGCGCIAIVLVVIGIVVILNILKLI